MAVRQIESEVQQKVLDRLVLFEDQKGQTIQVRIQAREGLSANQIYAVALNAFQQKHVGQSIRLKRKDIITFTGQINFEPPRANTDGYR